MIMDNHEIENSFSIPVCTDIKDLEPTAEELENIYKMIENGDFQLEWTCLGRRPPTPVDQQTNDTKETKKESESRNRDGFDFLDEMTATPQQMRIRREPNSMPKGSAKKKTTVFSGVLDSMKKHGRLHMTPSKTTESSNNNSNANSNANNNQNH